MADKDENHLEQALKALDIIERGDVVLIGDEIYIYYDFGKYRGIRFYKLSEFMIINISFCELKYKGIKIL